MKHASIMMATRNRSLQLAMALESIKAQNYQDIDIVVIDDASSDDTTKVLRNHGNGLRVVRVERPGGYRQNPSAVLNVGHLLTKTDIVIEQGGEVCHLTDCVTPLLKICRPGVVALARVHNGNPSEMQALKTDIQKGIYDFPADFTPETVKTNGNSWRVPHVGPHRIQLYCGNERPAPFLFLGAIHREDFRAIGGYDEHRLNRNDEDLANRLLAKGVRFCFVGNAVAFHLKHGKS